MCIRDSLKRVWKDIRKRATTEKVPSLIYQEPGLASRSVRDYLSDDVSEVWVDNAETAEAIREMASLLFPRKGDLVHLYEKHDKTLWEHLSLIHISFSRRPSMSFFMASLRAA